MSEVSREVAALPFHRWPFLSSCVLLATASPAPCLRFGLHLLSCGGLPVLEGLPTECLPRCRLDLSCLRPRMSSFLFGVWRPAAAHSCRSSPLSSCHPLPSPPHFLVCLMSCFMSSLSSMQIEFGSGFLALSVIVESLLPISEHRPHSGSQ